MTRAGRPRKHVARKTAARLDFDAIEMNVDKYLSGTVGDVKTLKNTVVLVIDNYFRLVTYPVKPWIADSGEIGKVDRIRLKILELVRMFSHRVTVQTAFVSGFRFVLNAFCYGRMVSSDKEWPFIKVLLTRFLVDIEDDNLLCSLGKMLSLQMSQTLAQGCRTELSESDVQLTVELTALIKSLGARIGRNREEQKNEKARQDDRASPETSFEDEEMTKNEKKGATPTADAE